MQKPAPVYGFNPGRMDVFWCAKDKSSVMQTWFDGSSWQTATITQGDVPFGFAPAVYDNAPGKMDVGWTDRVGKIWYTSLDGGQWTPPVELNPSNMAGAKLVPGTDSDNWSPPVNFAACSPLAACPNSSYRRSPNTEFLVCDSQNNVWDLLLDNGTWTVSEMALDDRMAFTPAQAIAQIYTDSPQPHLIWCDKDGKLRVSYIFSIPASRTTPQCISKYFETRISPQFSAGSFGNVSRLVDKMRWEAEWGDSVSGYIWPKIKDQLVDDSDPWDPITDPGAPPFDLGNALASALNGLCAGPSLYNSARFAKETLRKETRILLAQNPQGGEDLQRLNRMLLEDSYPGEMQRCLTYLGGVEYQPGVLAGLTPGRVDIFWSSLFQGAVMQTVWDGSQWSTNKIWDRYLPEGELVPVSGLSGGRIDLFCLHERDDSSGKIDLDDISWNGQGWGKTTIAYDLSRDNPPAAIYNPAQGRLNVFWAGEDGKLWNISSDGTTWTTPVEIGTGPMMRMPVMPAPEAIYGYRPGRMDVIYAGADKNVKQASGDGVKWNSVMLNPGEMVAAQGFQVSGDPPVLSFLWLNTIGEVLYEWFDGNWHISKLVNNAGGKIISIGGSPLGQVFVINDAGRLCKVDYQLGIGGSIQLADIDTPYPGYTGPFAPPTVFNPRFAPAVTDGVDFAPIATSGVNIYLCDNDLELCEVTEQWADANPVKTGGYTAQKLFGPLAYAPVAVGMGAGQFQHSIYHTGAFLFWCSKDNMSLRQSFYGNYGSWQTTGFAPGPMATGPAKLLLPNGEVHLFWGAQDGTLKHMWAIRDQIGDPNYPSCWHTEVVDSVEMGSPPVAIWNDAQRQIYVFWLDYEGQLKQTWLNPPNPRLPKLRTITIAPATSESMVWRDL